MLLKDRQLGEGLLGEQLDWVVLANPGLVGRRGLGGVGENDGAAKEKLWDGRKG